MKAILAALSHAPAPVIAFAVLGGYWGTFGAYVPEIKAGIGASDAEFGAALLFSGLGLCSALFVAPKVDTALGPRANSRCPPSSPWAVLRWPPWRR